VQTGALVAGPFELEGQKEDSVKYVVAFSHDGKQVAFGFASGSASGMIQIWDAQTGALVVGPFKPQHHPIRSVAFSPKGERLASASDDETIGIWDTQTGAHVACGLKGHGTGVNAVAFSPDGKRAASGDHWGRVRIWDAQTGALVAESFEKHDLIVRSVAFSPDGERLASGSTDKTIRIWDANMGSVIAGPFEGHNTIVECVAFSPDGRRVASGSVDGTILIQNAWTGVLEAGPLIFEGGPSNGVASVVFSSDGSRVAAVSSGDGAIRIWVIPQVQSPVSAFSDHTKLQDGWVIGAAGELIFWVPPIHRQSLLRPSNLVIIGGDSTVTKLDLTHFVHGTRWAECA
jgi:WD40 repeat protein